MRSGLDGLMEALSHPKFRWMRERATIMWPKWKEAVELVKLDENFKNRTKKKVRVCC